MNLYHFLQESLERLDDLRLILSVLDHLAHSTQLSQEDTQVLLHHISQI